MKKKIPIYVGAFATLLLVEFAIFYNYTKVNNLFSQIIPITTTIKDIKINLALAHLCLEEYLAGDQTQSFSIIQKYLDKSKSLNNNLLKITDNYPLYQSIDKNTKIFLRGQARSLISKINYLEKISNARYQRKSESIAGTMIDAHFDTHFKEIFNDINQIELLIIKNTQVIRIEFNNIQKTLFYLLPILILVLFYKIFGKIAQTIQNTKMMAIGEIASGLAHEINNPLTISIANVGQLKKTYRKQEIHDLKTIARFKKVENSQQRIAKIIEALAVYAKINICEKHVISLSEVLSNTINIIKKDYQNDSIQIKTISPTNEIFTEGNVKRIQNIMMNLITNAKDATEGNNNRLISISLKEVNGTAVINIADNGCGIPQKNKNKIFEPFFTTKKKSTGMGLGVVKEVVSDMNGELLVNTELDKGTSFTVILPTVM